MLNQPNIFEPIKAYVQTSEMVFSVLIILLGLGSAIAAKVFTQRSADRRLTELKKELQITVNGLQAKNEVVKGGLIFPSTPESKSAVIRQRVAARLKEASTAMEDQLSRKKRSKFASNALTVGQYILGGLLASSFVQQSMNPTWVGAMGVLVLVASLIKQNFHAEIDANDAQRKAAQLLSLIRISEDDLTILDEKINRGEDHSDEMIQLMKSITKHFTEIENAEAVSPQPVPVAVK